MRSDDNITYRKRDEGELGDFGETKPTNSFSGGETDHLFLSDVGEQFYDLDKLSGLAHPGDGRTACQLDYDRDGWIDFVVASANSPTVQLYRNRIGERYHPDAKGARMVALRFVGGNTTTAPSAEWSARDGYGAYVTLDVGEKPLIREIRCGDGRAAVNSRTTLVGVGLAERVRELTVRWPSGRTQTRRNVPVGQLVTVYEDPSMSPSGDAFHVEPYLKDVLRGRELAGQEPARLEVTLPRGDAPTKLNVLTAMSTHCKSCKKLQPQVKLLRETFAADEVGLWGIGTDLAETTDELEAYVEKQRPAYLVLSELPLAERERLRDHVIATFQDDLTPATVITDASGRILRTLPGIPTVSEVRELLER